MTYNDNDVINVRQTGNTNNRKIKMDEKMSNSGNDNRENGR